MLVDTFKHLLQLGERTAAIDGKRLVFLQARIGEARKPGRDFVRAFVEIVGELADRLGGLGDLRDYRRYR